MKSFFLVIRLGLEPKTPTLKVLCSTCWASESNLMFFLSKVLRYGRDSNPRPPAWQAGILTNWTTTPTFDSYRSRLRMQRYDYFLNLQAFWEKKSIFLVFSAKNKISNRRERVLWRYNFVTNFIFLQNFLQEYIRHLQYLVIFAH